MFNVNTKCKQTHSDIKSWIFKERNNNKNNKQQCDIDDAWEITAVLGGNVKKIIF